MAIRGLRQQMTQYGIRIRRAHVRRPFAPGQRIERERRFEDVGDHALLVEIQLGEPPQRIAAIREPIPQRLAVHVDVPQRLDPRIRR